MKIKPFIFTELNDKPYLFKDDVEEDDALLKDLSNRDVARKVFNSLFPKPPDYVEHYYDTKEC